MKPIQALLIVVLVFVFARNIVKAEDKNFLWESDGSLTIVDGAKDSGYIIEDGEVKTYIIPSDTETTIIQDGPSGKMIICSPAIGCY
tara:strand:+ start:354 stop:614 length:261 start_codon:yes stop_codon:yes gene_type:complete